MGGTGPADGRLPGANASQTGRLAAPDGKASSDGAAHDNPPTASSGGALRGHSPPAQMPGAVILFDGVCNFCSGAVQFILRRDRRGHFRFASLQGEAGRALASRFFPDPAGVPDSLVLIEDGRAFIRSDAVLRILRRLGPGWALVARLAVFPRPVRDFVYDRLAANRHRLFGRRDRCMVPPPEWRARFLDD